ncbi:hypothetical protein ACOME3_009964 [Neoechinorhynchus agilis]
MMSVHRLPKGIYRSMVPEDSDRRFKLANYNTIEDAVKLIVKCQKIVVITGAGISVSCGIPDFRSSDGFYSKLTGRVKDILSSPEDMFNYDIFVNRPSIFYTFVNELMFFNAIPSFSHHFLRTIDEAGKLLCNYTQNVDTLEMKVGLKNVEHCHGSFDMSTCTQCKTRKPFTSLYPYVRYKLVPYCDVCIFDTNGLRIHYYDSTFAKNIGIFKPDIVFFGEGLPISFNLRTVRDCEVCDLLIVIGSSMTVKPICMLPDFFKMETPRILINREILKKKNLSFDIEILGNCDVILKQLTYGIIQYAQTHNGYDASPFCELLRTQAPDFRPFRLVDTIDVFDRETQDKSISTSCVTTRLTRSRSHQRIVSFLKANCYLYISPNRYIFPGADEMLSNQDIVQEAVKGRRI